MIKYLVILNIFLFLSCKGGDSHIKMSDDKQPVAQKTEEAKQDPGVKNSDQQQSGTHNEGHVVELNENAFAEKVFDFRTKQEWEYNKDLPCVIDFYADWCKPCKMLSPILDELAGQYSGKINFYKVNTDEQRALAQAFGIQSLPTVLICPNNGGQPQMMRGLLPKTEYVKVFEQYLLK